MQRKALATLCATIGLTGCVGPNGSGPLLSATGASILEQSANPTTRFLGYLLGSAGQRQNAIDAQIQTQIQLATTTPYYNPTEEQRTTIGHKLTISKWIDINKDGYPAHNEIQTHQGPINLDGVGLAVDFHSNYTGPTTFRIISQEKKLISEATPTKNNEHLYLHIPAGSKLGLQENERTNNPGTYNLEVLIGTEMLSKQITIERGTNK